MWGPAVRGSVQEIEWGSELGRADQVVGSSQSSSPERTRDSSPELQIQWPPASEAAPTAPPAFVLAPRRQIQSSPFLLAPRRQTKLSQSQLALRRHPSEADQVVADSQLCRPSSSPLEASARHPRPQLPPPSAVVPAAPVAQGPLCRVCEENNEPEGKSSSCEGKAVGFVYSSAGKDSVLVTAWGSGQLQIDALADEIQPQWSIGIPTHLNVDSHGHTKSVAMICDSNSQDSLALRSHRASSMGSNVKSNTDAVWMEHSPPLLRLAIVDLALPKTSNGSSLSLFLDPLVPERFYCANGGGLDMVTLHFLPFSHPEMASTPPSVHPVITTGNNETDSPFLSGFVTITDAYGHVHLVGITCSGECFVVGMKGWKERTPLQLDIDSKSIKDVESSTTGMISKELIAGPDPPILPSSSSLRSLTPDSIEGKSTLHHYIKVFHEYYVEYGHKVFIELKEHADYLKTEMEDKHKRLQAVKQSLLSIEAKDQDLNKRIDRAFKVYNLLEKRIESFKMLPAANKKPLSQAEQEFKAQLDWFADVELDALCSSIAAMCARMKRFAHPSMGSAAGKGMPPCQTPKAGRSHVSDSQMSLMKSSLERLSLLNEENNLKLRRIEHELKNQEQ